MSPMCNRTLQNGSVIHSKNRHYLRTRDLGDGPVPMWFSQKARVRVLSVAATEAKGEVQLKKEKYQKKNQRTPKPAWSQRMQASLAQPAAHSCGVACEIRARRQEKPCYMRCNLQEDPDLRRQPSENPHQRPTQKAQRPPQKRKGLPRPATCTRSHTLLGAVIRRTPYE